MAIIESNQELKSNVNAKVQSLTEVADEHRKRADKLENDLERAKSEISKFMNWAEELKEKNQLKKEKLNMNKDIIKSQEKKIMELERAIVEAKMRETDLKREAELLQHKTKDLESK